MSYNPVTKKFTRTTRFTTNPGSENGDKIGQPLLDQAFDELAVDMGKAIAAQDTVIDEAITTLTEQVNLVAAIYTTKAALLASGADYEKYAAGQIIRAGDQLFKVALSTALNQHEITVNGVEGDGGLKLYEAGQNFTTRARLTTGGDTLGMGSVIVAGLLYVLDATSTDLTAGDGTKWRPLILIEFPDIATMTATARLWDGTLCKVHSGWQKQPETFKAIAAGTYTINDDTVQNLLTNNLQAVSLRHEFISEAELLLDTRPSAFFATDAAVSAEGTAFEVVGGSTYTMALSGASDHHLTTAGGVKLYNIGIGAGLGLISIQPAVLAPDMGTTKQSGKTRFNNTTTGAFPTGLVAANEGVIETLRADTGDGVEIIHGQSVGRSYISQIIGGVRSPWSEFVLVDPSDVPATNEILAWNGSSWVPSAPAPTDLFFRLNAANAGANVTTAQNILPQNVTLAANTQYEFEIVYGLVKSAGSTNHAISVGFGGTATLNNIFRFHTTSAVTGGATLAAPLLSNGYLTTAALTNLTGNVGAVAAVAFWIAERGTISVNAGGTFIPQYQLSSAPGGAYSVVAGAILRLRPLGAAGANVSQGTWS